MMKTEICAELKGNGRIQPVFEGLQVQAELRETLAITTITQSYRNAGSRNIEAVYTFPLPLEAVLLDMSVTLGEKTLKGTVFPKQEAEQRYEEAITDGDAPVMLQNPQPGVYTMNVGNLLPGEQARIMFRYAQFQRWQGDTLRYHLPTTIAPRYGNSQRSGIEPHQEPETSLLAENLFSFELKIIGAMAGRIIESPSHEIAIDHETELTSCRVRLIRKSVYMDRDLVITVKRGTTQTATASVVQDGEEYLLWGSIQPCFRLTDDPAPRSIKIVVDCSGSMGGDSIAQAREALLRVLDELRPQDWFNIVAFGNRATPLFNAQAKADQESLSYARGFLKKLDADMGGTEIGKALEMAVRLRCPETIQQDVLLITDGEIWEWEKVVASAIASQHRFFTVGVGSAVSEAFVRTLAERTGGSCELVTPNENMAERIHRHFKRIGTPRSRGTDVIWPGQPLRVFPEQMPTVYDGDTCNLFAWFSNPPKGDLQLRVSLPDGSMQVLCAGVETVDEDQDQALPRMAAALKLREISEEETGRNLALKYQLVSRWTNYLAVVVRDERDKAETLPDLHKVEQMLAAGWSGTGRVRPSSGGALRASGIASVCFCIPSNDKPAFSRKTPADALVSEPVMPLSHSAPAPPHYNRVKEEDHHTSLDHFMELLNITLTAGTMPITIHLPLLPAGLETILTLLATEGTDERTLVIIFLQQLAESTAGGQLSRQAKRVISKAYKELKVDQKEIKEIKDRLSIGLGELQVTEVMLNLPDFLR